jgi:predicted NBD/HSP70 family sugar kinase
MLRELTDSHVLDALIVTPRLTRAELAERTGISKPTIGESVRRLVAGGLLVDTGARTTGRGAVGSYFALADDIGVALAISIAPDGIVSELVDVHGDVITRANAAVRRPARPGPIAISLTRLANRLQASAPAPIRLAAVSAADPVDRDTSRLVELPYAPFLLGEFAPADSLTGVVTGPVVVDNDVNWAARAERHHAAGLRGDALDDFVYLYLGEGLGCAVVTDGEVRRGHHGFAGEIGHLLTTGIDGRACALIDVFAALGLNQPNSTAIDVNALIAAIDSPRQRATQVIAAAIGGVLCAAIAMADPEVVVLGGPWGTHPVVLRSVREHAAALPRSVAVRPAFVAEAAPLAGARQHAIESLRAAVRQRRAR